MNMNATREELVRRISALPLVRREKVREIRRQMHSATYRTDATAVARSLLKEQLWFELALTGHARASLQP